MDPKRLPRTRLRRPASRPGADPRPTTRRPLATGVYDRLRHLIVSLRVAPGTPLTELELCRRLGVSRTPVRSALQRLQQEGLAVAQGVGATTRLLVAPLTSSDMRQLFLMVGALNGVAARLAAELPPARRAALAARLESLTAELGRLAGDRGLGGVRAAQGLDRRFHRAYEEAVASPELAAELDALHARRERYVQVYTEALMQAHHLISSIAEHEAIIAAIRAGDADRAEAAAEGNFRNALVRFRQLVAVLGERGNWY